MLTMAELEFCFGIVEGHEKLIHIHFNPERALFIFMNRNTIHTEKRNNP